MAGVSTDISLRQTKKIEPLEDKQEEKALLSHAPILTNLSGKHERTLNSTKTVAKSFIISSTIGWYYCGIVDSIWILYIRYLVTKYYPTYNVHAIIVFLSTIMNVFTTIGILLFSFLSDKYGFGNLALITCGITVIACGLQCVYINMPLFITGFLLARMVEEDIEILSNAFVARYLPYRTAVLYTGYEYTVTNIGFILGLVTTGIITTYIGSYRSAFLFGLFIQAVRFTHLFIFVRNKEIYLTQQQTSFVEYYLGIITTHESDNSNESKHEYDNLELKEYEKELFPICLDKINELKADNNVNNDVGCFMTHNIKSKSQWYWTEFILNLVHFAILQSIYTVTYSFYAIYMLDRFDIITFTSMCQLGIIGVCDGIVAPLYPYFEAMTIDYMYACLVLIDVVFVILLAICFPATTDEWSNLYWIFMVLYGMIIGVSTAFSEIIILELQPKIDTGKMGGFQSASRYLLGIFTMFFVSYYWQSENQFVWYWFIQAICVAMALCMAIFLYVARVKFSCKNQFSDGEISGNFGLNTVVNSFVLAQY